MKLIYIIVLCFCNMVYASAQNTIFRAKVISNNIPLVGATVYLLKENIAGVTNQDGIVTINHKYIKNEIIRVSFVGYHTYKEMLVYDSDMLVISLVKDQKLLRELVVVSNKQNRVKKEESLSVDLVSASFLGKNNAGSLMTSLNTIAGISSIDIGSGQSKPIVRGLGFNRIAVSENGVKHEGQQWGSDHGLEIDQYAIDNMELVKGPSSLTYGSDAIGGMIIINTKQKPKTTGLGASLLSSFRTNNMSYTSSLNVHFMKKNFYFNSQFTYIDYADYKLPTDSINIYSFKLPLHRKSLRNTAGKNKSAYICLGYLKNNIESVISLSNYNSESGFFANAHGLEPRSVDTFTHDKSSRDINKPSQYVNHFKLSNKTKIKNANSEYILDLSFQRNIRDEYSTYTSHGFMPSNISNKFENNKDTEREFRKDIFTSKLGYNSKIRNHNLSLGLSAQYQINNIGGWSFIIPEFEEYKIGAFIYDKIKINDKMLLHFGLRADYANINIKDYYDWFESELIVNNKVQLEKLQRAKAVDRKFNNITAAIGFNLNLTDLFVKINLAKSYRLPTAKELSANGVNYHYFSYEKGNSSLLPEEAYQLDLGVDYSYFNLKANFTPFVSYFPNYIFLNPSSKRDYSYGAGNQVYNYMQTRLLRYGGELKLTYKISDCFNIVSSGEYVYSEQLSGSKKGFSLPFSPPASMYTGLDYNMPRKGRFVNTFFNLGLRMCAQQNRIVPPEKKTSAYNVFSFSCGTKYFVNNSYLDFNIKINNLFNTKYFNHMSFYRLIDVPEPGRDIVFSLKIPLSALK